MSIIAQPSPEDIQRFGGEAGRKMFMEKATDVQERLDTLRREDFSPLSRWLTVSSAAKGTSFITRSGIYAKQVLDSDGDEAQLLVNYFAPDPSQKKFDERKFRESTAECHSALAHGLNEKLRVGVVALATAEIPEWAREELRALLAGEIEPEANPSPILLPGDVNLLSLIEESGSLRSLGETFRKNSQFTRQRAAMVLGVVDRIRAAAGQETV